MTELTAALLATIGGGLPALTPFRTSISFDQSRQHARHQVGAPVAFSIISAQALPGAKQFVTLVADGVNTPTFPGFKKAGTSMPYLNTAGIVNEIEFVFNGLDYRYSITQNGDPVAAPRLTAVNGAVGANTITLTYSKALSAVSIPVASAFAMANSGGAQTVTGVSISGSTVTLTTSRIIVITDTITLGYTPTSSGFLSTDGEYAGGFALYPISAGTPVEAPGQVTGLTVGAITTTSVALSFTAPSSGGPVADYIVEYKTAASSTWLNFVDGVGTGTNVNVTGLLSSTPYHFRSRATNATSDGQNSATVSATTAEALTAPGPIMGLTVGVVTGSSIALSWSAPSSGGAPSDYLIEYKLSAASTWTIFADGVSTATSALVTSLTQGNDYVLRVTPLNTVNSGPVSSTVSATTPMAPGQVINLTVGAITTTSVALSWSAPLTGGAPTDYIVEYKTAASSTWLVFADGVGTSLSTNVTGLLSSTPHNYRVRATNAVSDGANSATVNATTADALTAPGAISGLTVGTVTSSSIALSWTAPSTGGAPSDYLIEYKQSAASGWTIFADGVSTATSALVTGVTQGNDYVLRVTPLNSVNSGPVSATVSATPFQRVIWDTDLDSDCDDITATALVGALVRRGEAQLIAAGVASPNAYAAPCLRVLLDYMGLTAVPLGAYKGTSITGPTTSNYTQGVTIAFRTPSNDSVANYPEVVSIYRTALAAAPDTSVKLMCGGTSTNFAALLQSPADGISALTGAQLVAAKVQSFHMMGGNFAAPTVAESNIALDVAAADYLAQNSPVPVYWGGVDIGKTVLVAYPFAADPLLDPFKKGWDLSSAQLTSNTRMSWDLMPVLQAVRGNSTYFGNSAAGTLTYSATSPFTNFTANPAGKNYYLSKTATDGSLKLTLDALVAEIAYMAKPAILAELFSTTQTAQNGSDHILSLPTVQGINWTINGGTNAGLFTLTGSSLTLPSQAVGTYAVTLRATSVLGFADFPLTYNVVAATSVLTEAVYAYNMVEGTGQSVADASPNALSAQLGATTGAESTDPAWLASGGGWVLDFSATKYLGTAYNALMDQTSLTLVAVVNPDTVTGNQVIAARRDGANGTSWQFRIVNGVIDVVVVTSSATHVYNTPVTVTVGQWAMITVRISGQRLQVRKNGIHGHAEKLLATLLANTAAGIYHGAEKNGSNVFGTQFDGKIAYSAYYKSTLPQGGEIYAEALARAAVSAKGIAV